MPNILCIPFPVEPSEIDLANKLVGRSLELFEEALLLLGLGLTLDEIKEILND